MCFVAVKWNTAKYDDKGLEGCYYFNLRIVQMGGLARLEKGQSWKKDMDNEGVDRPN